MKRFWNKKQAEPVKIEAPRENYDLKVTNNREDFYSVYSTLTPTVVKQAIEADLNLGLQDLFDVLVEIDSELQGKMQDRYSILKKVRFNYENGEGEPEAVLDFVKENLTRVLTKNVLEKMMSAVFYRFAVLEMNWVFDGSKYHLQSLTDLPIRAFEFSFHDADEKDEINNKLRLFDAESGEFKAIPDFKTVQTFAKIKQDRKWVGSLETLAMAVVVKYFCLQKDWPLFNEKFGQPLVVGTLSSVANTKDVEYLKTAVAALGSSANAVIPKEAKIDLVTPTNNSPEMFERLIRVCDEQIGKTITGQSGTSGTGDKASYASLQTLNGIRQDVAESSLSILEDAINNQIIKPLVDFNFTVTNYPKISLHLPDNLLAFADLDKKLTEIGIKFTKDYVQKRYDLEEDDFDIQEPQPEQQLLAKLHGSGLSKTEVMHISSMLNNQQFS